ncbi:MAG: NRDE family protein [Saprospiraceae bacterium]
MCTVSFYRDDNQTIITSNRDEHKDRPLALLPRKVVTGESITYYPIDQQSNGTWFAVKNNGNVLVLLNGAERKHIPNPPYRESRGLVLLDLVNSGNLLQKWNVINLLNIEPFTVIAFVDDQLFQIRWNEVEKKTIKLDTNRSYIWSSATLYSDDIISKREGWFSEFLNQKKGDICADDLISFHTHTQKNDIQNGLVMNRNHSMLTKNITQCAITKNNFTLTHFDLICREKSIITDILT